MTHRQELSLKKSLARLDDLEQIAIAAGHGFGHQPLGAPRNAGWTDIDMTDNVRPSYDQNYLRMMNPHNTGLALFSMLRYLLQGARGEQMLAQSFIELLDKELRSVG